MDAVEEQERNKPVLERIREETEKDDSLQLVKNYIKKGSQCVLWTISEREAV